MWSAEGGGSVHSKNRLVSSRQHRATEVRKLRFLSSCQYTTGVAHQLLGPHDTLPCVLMHDLDFAMKTTQMESILLFSLSCELKNIGLR